MVISSLPSIHSCSVASYCSSVALPAAHCCYFLPTCIPLFIVRITVDTGHVEEVHIGHLIKQNSFTIADIVDAIEWPGKEHCDSADLSIPIYLCI